MLCDALLLTLNQHPKSGYKFYIESGRKYHKLIMETGGSRSVHAFVDKKTGDVFKAHHSAPAKIVRYNLLIESREQCLSVQIGRRLSLFADFSSI